MTRAPSTRAAWTAVVALLTVCFGSPASAFADQPVVSVLADFEDDSVAALIDDVRNVPAADCTTQTEAIPARGQRSLKMTIGATEPGARVACALRYRVPVRFDRADRIGGYFWVKRGRVEVVFRFRDARGDLFETDARTLDAAHLWQHVAADVSSAQRLDGEGDPAWPIRVTGYVVQLHEIGRQEIMIDDLQVEHQVPDSQVVQGSFAFRRPTKIYEPGSVVDAAVGLENRSRREAYRVEVEFSWLRQDGSLLTTQRGAANLPESGDNYRSRQTLDFSQRIDEPGLYRLRAQARAQPRSSTAGPARATEFETTIAIAPSNRNVPRGRSTLFAVESNLLQEPVADQMIEIALASEIGVNLLALQTPWMSIEPRAGQFRYEELDRVVDALIARDLAVMLVLTTPPSWLPSDAQERVDRLGLLLVALSRHFGVRVTRYQLGHDLFTGVSSDQQAEALARFQRELAQITPDLRLSPPATGIDKGAAATAARDGLDRTVQTEGSVTHALATIDAARLGVDQSAASQDWWRHVAGAIHGPGHESDAEAVLRGYVHAAQRGVAGLIWHDLRDDIDPRSGLAVPRGLVRRDFSPRTMLAGFASAAGMLPGLRYAGPVLNTPEAFDSALFIGSDRQVAVLLPRPNRVRPALVSPFHVVPGALRAYDFERRPVEIMRTAGPPLVRTLPQPMFFVLELENPQPEPQIAFTAEPWVRAPSRVFCGAGESFTIEVDALQAVRRGFLRVSTDRSAPFTSSRNTKSLQARAGETIEDEITLTPNDDADGDFERSEIALRLSLDGRSLDLAIEVAPLVEVKPLKSGQSLVADGFQLGRLRRPGDRRGSAEGTVFAGYDRQAMHVTVVIRDDRSVSFDGKAPASGDELLIGIALENTERHVVLRLTREGDRAAVTPVWSAPGTHPDRITATLSADGENLTFQVQVAAGALGNDALEAGQRLLLAVCYLDDDADGFGRQAIEWGQGLESGLSTDGYRHVRLVQR